MRAEFIKSIVTQGRRIATAGYYEGNNGKDRRRLPFDKRVSTRRKLRIDIGNFAANIVQRLYHVGAGREFDVDFRRAADRLGTNAAHTGHAADNIFDFAGNAELDLAYRQSGRFRDN